MEYNYALSQLLNSLHFLSMPNTNPYQWFHQVTETSHALDLEPGVFAWDDPRKTALSLKHSADTSQQRKSGPFASAIN